MAAMVGSRGVCVCDVTMAGAVNDASAEGGPVASPVLCLVGRRRTWLLHNCFTSHLVPRLLLLQRVAEGLKVSKGSLSASFLSFLEGWTGLGSLNLAQIVGQDPTERHAGSRGGRIATSAAAWVNLHVAWRPPAVVVTESTQTHGCCVPLSLHHHSTVVARLPVSVQHASHQVRVRRNAQECKPTRGVELRDGDGCGVEGGQSAGRGGAGCVGGSRMVCTFEQGCGVFRRTNNHVRRCVTSRTVPRGNHNIIHRPPTSTWVHQNHTLFAHTQRTWPHRRTPTCGQAARCQDAHSGRPAAPAL